VRALTQTHTHTHTNLHASVTQTFHHKDSEKERERVGGNSEQPPTPSATLIQHRTKCKADEGRGDTALLTRRPHQTCVLSSGD
jgi:hypothetical protein